MKKICILILCFLMVVLAFSACNNKEEQTTDTDVEASGSESSSGGQSEVPNVKYEGFVITEANKKKLEIYCGNPSNQKTKAAAGDLRNYIRKMTGWTIPIVRELSDDPDMFHIIVGACDITEELGYECESGYPGKESVTVSQKDNYLILMGNDDGLYNGTQFSVNLILEKLGCGWFAEDPLWTIVPSLDVLDLNVGDVYLNFIPRFSSRSSRVLGASPNLAHRWYQGGEKTMLGHWLYQVVPATEYADHPEWFALVNGTRNPENITYWHFCYSNPEFADRIADEVIKKFDAVPELVSMTIAANDGWEYNWCECDTCKSLGNVSDVMVCFANNVAQKVSQTYPEKRLQIYSYHNTYLPPQNTVKLHEMIELMLCRETNMYQPLDEDFMMPAGKDPVSHIEFTQSWRQNALEYIEKTSPTHVSIWDWYCIAADEKGWRRIPWVQGEVAIRNQAVYEELGAEYVFYDHGPLDSYSEPNTTETYVLRWPLWYVAAKASFDGSLDEKEILSDACQKLFGSVSQQMFDYFMLLSDMSKNCTAYSNTWIPASLNDVYPYEDRKQFKVLAEEILAAAAGDSTDVQERVRQQLAYWLS